MCELRIPLDEFRPNIPHHFLCEHGFVIVGPAAMAEIDRIASGPVEVDAVRRTDPVDPTDLHRPTIRMILDLRVDPAIRNPDDWPVAIHRMRNHEFRGFSHAPNLPNTQEHPNLLTKEISAIPGAPDIASRRPAVE